MIRLAVRWPGPYKVFNECETYLVILLDLTKLQVLVSPVSASLLVFTIIEPSELGVRGLERIIYNEFTTIIHHACMKSNREWRSDTLLLLRTRSSL